MPPENKQEVQKGFGRGTGIVYPPEDNFTKTDLLEHIAKLERVLLETTKDMAQKRAISRSNGFLVYKP